MMEVPVAVTCERGKRVAEKGLRGEGGGQYLSDKPQGFGVRHDVQQGWTQHEPAHNLMSHRIRIHANH